MPAITNITQSHRNAFEALASGKYNNFALFSCFVNGEPASAIVAVHATPDGFDVVPLFVSVTDSLVLTDHDNRIADYNGGTVAGVAS